jgi:hypothetical protein
MARITASQTPTTKTPETPKPAPGALTYDEAKSLGIDLNTATYDPATNTYLANADPNAAQTSQIQDQLKSAETEINSAFDTVSKNADAATQNLIASIHGIYNERINEMRESNRRATQTLNTFGVREGTNRYAGEVATEIISADERAGLARIATLAAQETQLMSSAEQALQDKKYSLFIQQRNELGKVREEKQKQLQTLQDKALKAREDDRKQQIQSSRDAAVAGLIQQGVTDPSRILDYLNYDDNGKMVGDFTAKEVADTVKNLSPEGDLKSLTGATKNFYVLKQKGMLPDSIANLPPGQQLFAYLHQEKQATTVYKNSTKGDNSGAEPTPKDVETIRGALNSTETDGSGYSIKGKDNYSDPFVFKQLYNNWTSPPYNYSPQSFLKNFPPKDYINPEDNKFLPSYLQTPAKVPKEKSKVRG